MDSPANNAPTSNPTRTYGKIKISCYGINQRWQISWVVRAVRFHLHNQICPQFQGPLKAGFVGAPESELSIAFNQYNPILITLSNSFHHRRCPVRRVVIDHNNKQLLAIEGENPLNSLSNGFLLIKGGNTNSNFRHFN